LWEREEGRGRGVGHMGTVVTVAWREQYFMLTSLLTSLLTVMKGLTLTVVLWTLAYLKTTAHLSPPTFIVTA
jgi:hypothetical protein